MLGQSVNGATYCIATVRANLCCSTYCEKAVKTNLPKERSNIYFILLNDLQNCGTSLCCIVLSNLDVYNIERAMYSLHLSRCSASH